VSAHTATHTPEDRGVRIIADGSPRATLNEERSHFVVGVRKSLGRDRFQRRQQIYAGSR
jgi:hypothetical protein